MADRIVGFRESEWPAARDAINHVRRGALEHPFHRRIQPVMSVPFAMLELFRISGDSTTLYGGRDGGGVAMTGTGSKVVLYDYNGDQGTAEPTDDVDLTFSTARGIFFHADYVICAKLSDDPEEPWRVVSSGQETFNRCLSQDGGNKASIPGTVGPGLSAIQVDCDPPLTGALADSTLCTVQWCSQTKTFIINGAGCPS